MSIIWYDSTDGGENVHRKLKILLAALLTAALILLSGCAKQEQYAPPAASESAHLPEISREDSTQEYSSAGAFDGDAEKVRPQISEPPREDLADDVLVRVADYIPDIVVELRYATEDNFVGEIMYDFTEAYLRFGTVKKLRAAQEELRELGYGIKIWDAFRPVETQFVLWEAVPDSRYVANPHTGYSSHNCGNTVDITLVDSEGNELEMPSGFDDFSELADRHYNDVSDTAAENSRLLEEIMERNGFAGYSAEWWHYADEMRYSVAYELPEVTS